MRYLTIAASAALFCFAAAPAYAHGVVGQRFFPATLSTEDPVVADELALPTISSFDDETEISMEFAKRITPRLAVSLEGEWTSGDEGDGFQNLETGIKYQLFTSADHESVFSIGVDVEWGGTGAERIGAEDVTTIAPAFYFGKGFGDASPDWLKPLAVTGSLAYAIPTEGHAEDASGDAEAVAHVASYGLAFEYSLPYLAANVRDLSLPDWVNHLTPLVELRLDQPVRNRGEERATGSVNPGLIWSGRRFQIGAEAIIPINDASGDDVGFVIQAHYYLDDLFPRSLGRPLFGQGR
ncbi:MAG TPA: hypothetical protein VG841_09905 [Caulobacterales bacterium]|nr:hypothetical protein [Caulobacterales bacterium]